MAEWRYEIQTEIPRDFDPEVEGTTLDSIIESYPNVIDWRIPFREGNTLIIFDSKRQISVKDINYLKEQLKKEFDNEYFDIRRIREGESDSVGCRNLVD